MSFGEQGGRTNPLFIKEDDSVARLTRKLFGRASALRSSNPGPGLRPGPVWRQLRRGRERTN